MPMFTMLIVAMFKMFTMFTMGNDKKKNLSMVSIVAIAVEGKASKRQTAHQAIPWSVFLHVIKVLQEEILMTITDHPPGHP